LNSKLDEANHMKNVLNKNLEEDLKYEQEQNLKMETDIREFEGE